MNQLAAVHVEDGSVELVDLPGPPHGIVQGAVSPDGRFVFVSNRHQAGGIHDHHGGHATASGTLVVIRAGAHEVEAVLEVGRYAAGVGVPAPPRRGDTP